MLEPALPSLALDPFSTLAAWQALAADGVTPSTAMALSANAALDTPSGDHQSLSLSASSAALGHMARCSFAPVDLSPYDELRLVMRASRAAPAQSSTGTATAFYLELHLGSAALPTTAAANLWHRRLPFNGADTWDTLRISLDDLPAAVRGALSVAELRCIDASQPFVASIDEAMAVRPSMLVDVEAALQARLHQKVSVAGTPVPAVVTVAGNDLPGTLPTIAIVPLDARSALERSAGSGQRCDFVQDGYRVRAGAQTYELDYGIEVLAATRAAQAAVLDFLLGALPPYGLLRVAGTSLAIEAMAAAPPLQVLLGVPTPRQRLYYRVWAWQDQAATQSVRPTKTVVLPVDWREVAHA